MITWIGLLDKSNTAKLLTSYNEGRVVILLPWNVISYRHLNLDRMLVINVISFKFLLYSYNYTWTSGLIFLLMDSFNR